MNIKFITVGKLKEKYWTAAVEEYIKRLNRYCKISCVEVKDEKIPEKYSDAERRKAVEIEGDRILKNCDENALIVTLEINGVSFTSEAFAEQIKKWTLDSPQTLIFIIGGSLGLSSQVLARSDFHLSFSAMTFPHQLFRVMLLEQIYRAFKINNHEPYHK